jgi:hypothetical protein
MRQDIRRGLLLGECLAWVRVQLVYEWRAVTATTKASR